MDEVTLIVKAPNQQVADQTVTCEPSWTIGRLKGHLEEVYPCRPRSQDQKLIYSGRLLSDSVVLKDVLRKFEGQDTHTVHLVCSSKSDPPRPTPQPRPRPQQQQQPPQPQPQPQPQTQQQHYEQWLRSVYAQPPDAAMMMLAAQVAWMQQYYNMAGNPLPPQTEDTAEAHEAPPLPRDDPADDDPDEPNRDWLDWFYNMSRWILIFSVVYFYSNPVRFFSVFVLGTLIYLFRARVNNEAQNDQRQDNVIINNNNNNDEEPPRDDSDGRTGAEATEGGDRDESSASVAWSIIVSFFSSLIPDAPNARN